MVEYRVHVRHRHRQLELLVGAAGRPHRQASALRRRPCRPSLGAQVRGRLHPRVGRPHDLEAPRRGRAFPVQLGHTAEVDEV